MNDTETTGWLDEDAMEAMVVRNPVDLANPQDAMNSLNATIPPKVMNPVQTMRLIDAVDPLDAVHLPHATNALQAMHRFDAADPLDAMDAPQAMSPSQRKHLVDAMNCLGPVGGFGMIGGSGSLRGFNPLFGVDPMYGSEPMDGVEQIRDLCPNPLENLADFDVSVASGTAAPWDLGNTAPITSTLDIADVSNAMDVEATDTVDATGRTNVPSAPKPPTRATPDEWLAHKDTIIRLFKDEDRTLEDVMEILGREHNFYATANACKKKLKKWGVTKNFREKEVFAILHAMRNREAVGKRSRITIRGHVVDPQKLESYIRRNGSILPRFAKGEGVAVPLVDFDIACRTPSPELSAGLRDAERNRTVEELLHCIRDYVNGSFDSGTWFLDDDGNCYTRKSDTARRLLGGVSQTLNTLWRITASDRADLIRILSPVFDSLEAVLKAELYETRAEIFTMVVKLYQSEHRPVALMVLDYLANLSLRIFGRRHPVAQIWRCTKGLWDLANADIVEKLCIVEIDALQAHSGEASMAVTRMYSRCSNVMYELGEHHQFDSRIARILESRPQESYDSCMAELCLDISWIRMAIVYEEGGLAQAGKELAAVLDLVRRWDPPWEYYWTAWIKYCEADWEGAEHACRVALSEPSLQLDWDFVLADLLATLLQERGEVEEAAKVRQDSLERVYARLLPLIALAS